MEITTESIYKITLDANEIQTLLDACIYFDKDIESNPSYSIPYRERLTKIIESFCDMEF